MKAAVAREEAGRRIRPSALRSGALSDQRSSDSLRFVPPSIWGVGFLAPLLWAICTLAAAAPESDLAACADNNSPDALVGCTRLIDAGLPAQ